MTQLRGWVVFWFVCCMEKVQALSPSSSMSEVRGKLPKGFTGVRFSLYPNMSKEFETKEEGGRNASLKEAIKFAVKDLPTFGVEILPDDVSSCLLGPEPALFEAVRVAFGRAARTRDGRARNVSMQCTFSAGCPGEPDESPLPPRTAPASSNAEFVPDAFKLPPRVACQFAVYPLGTTSHMAVIYDVIDHAKRSACWKGDTKTHFCSMLDGEGNAVFDTLQSSFKLARKRGAGHVVMTATLTANKSAWAEADPTSS